MASRGGVLVVEDFPDTRDAVLTFLAGEGIQAVGVANGREALDRLRAGFRPSLILLDLAMPVMDGFEFRRLQLADSELAAIPVVVLSAGGSYARDRANELGMPRFLSKPVSPEQLMEVVAPYCTAVRPQPAHDASGGPSRAEGTFRDDAAAGVHARRR